VTSTASPTPEPLSGEQLARVIEVADVRVHLEALQGIADAQGGNRATGTPAFDASVRYVAERLQAAGYRVDLQEFAFVGGSSVNLVIERIGSGDGVVMLGAHLDSVLAGPGINDNGSGVGVLLVVAERLADLPAPARTIRIAFWGAEEGGPHGSAAYVDAMAPAERERIAAYLNFDMLGSPNFVRFVYAEPSAAPGSDALTSLFAEHFEDQGLAWDPIDLAGDSDHGAFASVGIPTGGLFSGGRELKTDAQAAAHGGIAGEPADPCSDVACDTIANISDESLEQMADAIAHVLGELASP
jgi:aminopeptidase S